MDASPPVVTVRFNRFLPYWAVFQTDLRQTARSWVYRLWVLMDVMEPQRPGLANEDTEDAPTPR